MAVRNLSRPDRDSAEDVGEMDSETAQAVRKHRNPGTRGPDDLEGFCSKVVEEMSEGRHTAEPSESTPHEEHGA